MQLAFSMLMKSTDTVTMSVTSTKTIEESSGPLKNRLTSINSYRKCFIYRGKLIINQLHVYMDVYCIPPPHTCTGVNQVALSCTVSLKYLPSFSQI